MSKIVWEDVKGELKAFHVGPNGKKTLAVWAPQPGSQAAFLSCPVFEVLYEGTRGPGKTDALLMSFGQHVGRGFKDDWRGVLFRQTFPQLSDVIAKTKKWFPQIWPDAKFNETKTQWTFPDGETLLLRHMQKPADYYNYHGHAYPWIGWEELTTWADDKCYKLMMACSRSTNPKMPRMYRSTTNPYGVGHNWVKHRFRISSLPEGKFLHPLIDNDVDEESQLISPPRIALRGTLQENRILLHADPDYPAKIVAAARNEAEKRAWLYGDWDVVAGGMFDDLWFEVRHKAVVEPFDIPHSWVIDRAFDWGSSRPFSVGWWAQSDGSDYIDSKGKKRRTVRGDLFRIAEWYGWSGQPNEGVKMLATQVSQGIIQRELNWGLYGKVRNGVADAAIFSSEDGPSIADNMAQPVKVNGKQYPGLRWHPSDKRPGSRKQGWEKMREMLGAVQAPPNGIREKPGLYVFNTCDNFLRTVPSIPRDEKDMDDVDSDAEDHIADECRYRVRFERPIVKGGLVRGTN